MVYKADMDRDRIVAVFALGQEWQFKGWKWKHPVEIFNKGMFLCMFYMDSVWICSQIYG